MPQYSFSLNGENWSGAFASRDAALAAAMQKCSGAADPPGTVFVGEILGGEVFADHLGKVIVEEMRSRAQSGGIEGGSEYLRELTAGQMDELDSLLERTTVGWLQKHSAMPQSHKMEAISEHLTPVPHRGLGLSSNGKKEVQDLGVGEFPG